MNMLYIAFKDFSNLHFGANSKVLSQCRAFEEYGYDVTLIGRQTVDTAVFKTDNSVEIIGKLNYKIKNRKLQNLTSKCYQMKCIEKYVENKKFEVCYIRYDFSDKTFIRLLKVLKKKCKKIILELPTYPYEAENNIGVLNKIKMLIDLHYRKQLKEFVDFIVTFYAGYDELFGIPVKVIPNGFDFSTMNLVKEELPKEVIHIIAVSSMREWHGYERIIKGLHTYYLDPSNNINVVLHLVGNGRDYYMYKELICKYQLQEHVILEGPMHGKKLDELYEKCALGIDSLARHRSGIDILSSLKSREYGAKGLPIINSCKIDIIENDFRYMLQVPANENEIDIKKIIEFYQKCYSNKNRNEVANYIREYIEKKSSMKNTLSDIIAEINK